jgi:exosortase
MILPRFFSRNGWTVWHLLLLAGMTALGVAITFDAWADILRIAIGDPESQYILLVPLIVGWLIYVRRERLRFVYPRGGWIGLVLVAIGWAVSSYGYSYTSSPWAPVMRPVLWIAYSAADTLAHLLTFGKVQVDFLSHLDEANQTLWHSGSVLLVCGCVLTVAGRDALARFLPAWMILVFLVPVPGMIRQPIALPLQEGLAAVTQVIFEVLEYPIDRSGNKLVINGVEVAVAEACNGMRMVFALVLVSFAFAFAHPLKGPVRLLIIAASPLSAMVCNILRMIPTVLIYGQSRQPILGIDGHVFAEQFHNIAGWVMLVIAFMILLGILRVLQWALVPVTRYTLAYD